MKLSARCQGSLWSMLVVVVQKGCLLALESACCPDALWALGGWHVSMSAHWWQRTAAHVVVPKEGSLGNHVTISAVHQVALAPLRAAHL